MFPNFLLLISYFRNIIAVLAMNLSNFLKALEFMSSVLTKNCTTGTNFLQIHNAHHIQRLFMLLTNLNSLFLAFWLNNLVTWCKLFLIFGAIDHINYLWSILLVEDGWIFCNFRYIDFVFFEGITCILALNHFNEC